MKIGIIGCGALGSYYGAQLCRSGAETHFLLRSDFDVVRQHGVRIRSVEGDFVVRPACARQPQEIGPCDLVLIALKTTANDQLPWLLPPLVGSQSTVMTLQNGLGNEAALAALVGPEPVLGGLCFVCLNRTGPGEIQHTAHGMVVMGEYLRPPGPRLDQACRAFAAAGVPCRVTDDLERAHWEKLIWNVPFNGLGVAGIAGYAAVLRGHAVDRTRSRPCLPTDELLGDPRWEQLVRELMHEIIATARALGYRLNPALAEENIQRTRVMGAYRASTLIDFERGQPLEIESLFREPLRQAQRAAVPTPRLAALCAVLDQLERRGG